VGTEATATLPRLVLDQLDRIAGVVADKRKVFGRRDAHLEGHLHALGLQFREHGGQVLDLEAEVLHAVRAEVFRGVLSRLRQRGRVGQLEQFNRDVATAKIRDLLTGAGPSYVATLVERQSRYVMLVRLPNKETHTVVRALARRVRRLPQGLMKSLTWDRGTEFAAHRTFTLATDVAVYFCDPQSPWQRGSNENTNGLLRQYLKHRTDLSVHTQAQLDAIAHRLNTRPRLTLGFQTPAAKLAAIVASTS